MKLPWIKRILIACGVAIGILISLTVAFFIWAHQQIPSALEPDADGNYSKEAMEVWLAKTAEAGQFNGGVLVVDGGEVIVSATFGTQHPDRDEPLLQNTAFRLGSVSKQFTAATVMAAQQDGLLEFDDLISEHLPELAGWQGITIRHFLHHTSGAPDYMFLIDEYTVDQPLTTQGMVKELSTRFPELVTSPNEEFAYSNTGYVLLAAIVERVTDRSLEVYARERLFEPLEMTEARVWNLVSPDADQGEPQPTFIFSQPALPLPLDGVVGDGGFFCSMNDLEIWDRSIREQHVLSPELLAEAFQSGVLNNGAKTGYGFGWILDESNKTQSHTGGWLGARSIYWREAEKGRVIVVVDNEMHDTAIHRIHSEIMEKRFGITREK